MHAALDHATNAFGIRDQRHIQAFFRENNSEVTPENISLEEAGLAEGTGLALRPSRANGGA